MQDFNTVVEMVDELPIESQFILLDVLKKRISEKQRELFIKDVNESREEFLKGEFEQGNSSYLFKSLNL